VLAKNWHGKLHLPERESAVYMLKSLFNQLLRDGSSRESAVDCCLLFRESESERHLCSKVFFSSVSFFSGLMRPSQSSVLTYAYGTQFTCFTSTKVQILTPEELQTAPLVLKALTKSRRCS
jgi:hypothetical protein